MQRDGAGPGDVAASPTAIFTPKPGAADKAIGTCVFRYRAVKPGQAKLRVVYVLPGGPGCEAQGGGDRAHQGVHRHYPRCRASREIGPALSELGD